MRCVRLYVQILAFVFAFVPQPLISQSPQHSSAESAAARSTRPKQSKPKLNCTNNGTYVNSKGETVRRPESCSAPPEGATAQCRDGNFSFSRTRNVFTSWRCCQVALTQRITSALGAD